MQQLSVPASERAPIPAVRLGIRIAADEPIVPAAHPASMWRGIVGAELKKMSVGDTPPPPGFPLALVPGLFTYLFETPAPPQGHGLRRLPAAPHPYVIQATGTDAIPPGEDTWLEISLLGAGAYAAGPILHALDRALSQGVGHTRGVGHIVSVGKLWQAGERVRPLPFQSGHPFLLEPPVPLASPPCPATVVVSFTTPLRLQVKGKITYADRFHPGDWLMSVIRRISLVRTFHGAGPLELDFRALRELAQRAELIDAEFRALSLSLIHI